MYELIGGKLWQEDHFVENSIFAVASETEETVKIQLQDEDLIVPGLVDFHTHLWSPSSVSPFGLDDGRLFSQGIVAAQEPGSFGSLNWEAANRYWANASSIHIKAFMHLLPEGLAVFPPANPTHPEEIDVSMVTKAVMKAKESGRLQGVKIHLGWLPYKDKLTDRKLLQLARKVADDTDTKVMVHVSNQFVDMEETMSMMKAGDVVTHIYTGLGNTVLNERGEVVPAVLDAHKRGVVFDVGAATTHFSWDVFEKSYAQGVSFDTLGSDITIKSWKKIPEWKVYHLYYFLSVLLELGISPDEVFGALTKRPAEYLGCKLSYDRDCLLLKKHAEKVSYVDGCGAVRESEFVYLPQLFVHKKKTVRI